MRIHLEAQTQACRLCANGQKRIFSKGKYGYFKCGECELVSTYPMPNEQEIVAHYKKKFESGNYSLSRQYSKQYNSVYAHMADELENYLAANGQSLEGKSVLDIGCFTGEFLSILQERKADVYGLELQQDAVDIANSRLGGRVFQGDVLATLPKKDFDIVTMLGVVEHVTMPEKLLERALKLLGAEGVVMIQTPNSASVLAKLFRQFWPPYAPVEHIHLFAEKTIKASLSKLGFENLKVKAHWKKLVPNYVFNMMDNFGPELKKVITPIYKVTPKFILEKKIPFYGGEMLVFGAKGLAKK